MSIAQAPQTVVKLCWLQTDGGVRSPRCAVQIFLHLGEVEYAKRRAQGASVSGAYFLASQADTLVGA